MEAQFTTLGAVVGLIIAIVLIIKKVQPAYSLILGALIGGLIGGGKEMMEGSDVMSSFEIRDCSVSGSIAGGGEYTDAVVGDPACAVSVDCQSDMSITETVSDAA